jgi:agmatinase
MERAMDGGAAMGRFLEGPDTTFEDADVVVLPVPYEGTVSWGRGTAAGPRAIVAASAQVEQWDDQLGRDASERIWTAPPLDVARLAPEAMVRRVEERCGALLDAGKWPLVLGGEHSITPGAVAAAAARHGDLHVVQLDAHADLREEYEGTPWSHACAMARCLEHAPVRAIGIRSYSEDEAERLRAGIAGYDLLHARELGQEGWIPRALGGLDGHAVYLTIDVDYFDPSLVPATGTPEPGGGAWWPTLELLDALFRRARVVAADVVELAPAPGLHHADFLAARLAYKLIALARQYGPLDRHGRG